MEICILAGGPASLVPDLESLREDVTWVGVDRGMCELKKRGILPSYAFGDFDSVSNHEKHVFDDGQRVFRFPPEKDKTDLELAVDWALGQQAAAIRIYGATGGRMDHVLANLYLLKKGLPSGMEMQIIDRQNSIMMKPPGVYDISFDEKYPYISFLPLGSCASGLTLEGFKYPLVNASLEIPPTLTVSNELIEKTGTYSFTGGIMIVVRSRDESNGT